MVFGFLPLSPLPDRCSESGSLGLLAGDGERVTEGESRRLHMTLSLDLLLCVCVHSDFSRVLFVKELFTMRFSPLLARPVFFSFPEVKKMVGLPS